MSRAAIAVAALVLVAPAAARAQDASSPEPPPAWAPPPKDAPPRFGERGQVAIVQGTSLAVSRTSFDDDSSSTMSIGLQLAGDYFIAPRLSVGGTFILGYEHQEPFKVTTLSVSGRIGYVIRLGPRVSVWPILAAGIAENEYTDEDTSLSQGQTRVFGAVYVPVLFHPAPHFFLGLGPIVATDFSNDYTDFSGPLATRFGVQSLLGGWF